MRTARRSVSSIADEHAHTDIPDRGLGALSDDRFLRRSSMEHWNVRPVVKEIAKGSARIAFLRGCLPAFVLGLRVYRHCTLIFLGGRLPCPPPPPCSRPLREGWICRGGNPGNSARPLSHLPQKTLRQSADWYSYLARLDSRREKSYLSRPAKAGKPETFKRRTIHILQFTGGDRRAINRGKPVGVHHRYHKLVSLLPSGSFVCASLTTRLTTCRGSRRLVGPKSSELRKHTLTNLENPPLPRFFALLRDVLQLCSRAKGRGR